jgi:hypothetical protein
VVLSILQESWFMVVVCSVRSQSCFQGLQMVKSQRYSSLQCPTSSIPNQFFPDMFSNITENSSWVCQAVVWHGCGWNNRCFFLYVWATKLQNWLSLSKIDCFVPYAGYGDRMLRFTGWSNNAHGIGTRGRFHTAKCCQFGPTLGERGTPCCKSKSMTFETEIGSFWSYCTSFP